MLDLQRIAREAGMLEEGGRWFSPSSDDMLDPQDVSPEHLREFARLVLEEAAKVCDCVDNYANPMTARDAADAIRALLPQDPP